MTTTDKIREWHNERLITVNGNTETQLLKLMEELGELTAAVIRNDKNEVMDAIGDMYVVLVAVAELEGTKIEECIDSAYDEIKDRRGYLNEQGVFIKEEK
jgi:NTP pyrophosphatase (non-canonical NTP hydrolase)